MLTSLASRPLAAFPVFRAGRLPHHSFRGLRSVHIVAARVVAEPPKAALVVGVLQPMSLPPSSAPTATGWSDSCRAGFAPAEEWRLSRRTETSVRMAAGYGIRSLSNYMLYNFMDTPDDLYARLELNIALNEELGIRIWSFPMRYQPVRLKDRSHVGKNWSRYFLRSFQIMLQATRGVVSGNGPFFRRAYGNDQTGFRRLLSYPHGFIFRREHYENGPGRSALEDYNAIRARMTEEQEAELLGYLGTCVGGEKARLEQYRVLKEDRKVSRRVRDALVFHALGTKDEVYENSGQILSMFSELNPDPVFPTEEEIVEDAGLFDVETTVRGAHGTREPPREQVEHG